MKELIKTLHADKIIYLCLLGGITLLVTSGISIGVFYSKIPPLIPIFNQMPWGELRLGSTFQIFIPLVLAFGFYCINALLIHLLYDKTPLVSRFIAVTTLFIALFTLLLSLRTLNLVL